MSRKVAKKKSRTHVRQCLCCRRRFESEGPHNRICHRCKATKFWREGESRSYSFMKQG